MDLDDDELWATQYAKRYIKKSTVEKDYISKDKIRDKIQEYQENMKKYAYADKNIFNENNIRQEVITVLNELLEE